MLVTQTKVKFELHKRLLDPDRSGIREVFAALPVLPDRQGVIDQQVMYFCGVLTLAVMNDNPPLRRRIGNLESADTVGHANHAQSPQPGIGVGCESGPLFIACVDELKFAPMHLFVEPEDIIAGDSEHMPHAVALKALNEVIADGAVLAHDARRFKRNWESSKLKVDV